MKHYAGLDLSMEETHVCVVGEAGKLVFQAKVPSDPQAIAAALNKAGGVERAVIESGRMTPAICRGLKRLGVNVVCIHAHQAHLSLKAMKANKTDPHDAAGLAQLARTGFYKEVHVKSAAAHGVKSVIAARALLVGSRVRLDNTIRGLCAAFGIKVGPGQGKEFVGRARQAARTPGLGEAVASLLSVRDRLMAEIGALDALLNEIARTSVACQILTSIPGVGVQTAAAFAAAVDDATGSNARAPPAPISALFQDAISPEKPTGSAGSPNRATPPCASFSMKRPIRS